MRTLTTLAAAVLLLGIADSMVGTYLVLFVTDGVGLSPVQAGLLSAAPAAGGIFLTALVGRRFDVHPTKVYAVGAALLSGLGFVLLSATTSFWVLLLIALTLLASLQTIFPQLFALARVVLGGSSTGQRAAPLLRSGWSLAWALGPLLGAVLLAWLGFTALLWSAAIVLAVTALTVAVVPSPRSPISSQANDPACESEPEADPDQGQQRPGLPPSPRALGLLVASVVLFFLAMFAGSIALPLYVTRQLELPNSTVGYLYSACAVVEVLTALGLIILPARTSQRVLITVGMIGLVIYFAITVAAHDVLVLLLGQVARGIAIAVVGAAGIRYFQDLMPSAVGRATSLFSNAATAGALVAGVLAGVTIQYAGYATSLLLCGVTVSIGAIIFVTATTPRLLYSNTQLDDSSTLAKR